MSEVYDAVQVIMVAGKTIYMAGRVGTRTLSSFIKLVNTIYLSKWKGSASLHRLRQIKGDDMVFINVSSEKQSDLSFVEKEMKAHGILYARMPDLCGGDGRTQYAVASSDLPKLKPMLLDHAVGKEKRIRVGLISEKDYLGTGLSADGVPTKEYAELQRSALQEKEKTAGSPIPGIHIPRGQPVQSEIFEMQQEKQAMPDFVRVQGNMSLLRAHDLQMTGREEDFLWIDEEPIIKGQGFSLYSMGDGLRGLIILHADEMPASPIESERSINRGEETAYSITSMHHRAVIFRDRSYKTIDLQTLRIGDTTGDKAIRTIRSGNIYRRNEKLKSILEKSAPTLGQELVKAAGEMKIGGR